MRTASVTYSACTSFAAEPEREGQTSSPGEAVNAPAWKVAYF